MYAKSEEYSNFIALCKEIGEESWMFVFQKFSSGDYFSKNAIQDLTYTKHFNILETIKENALLKTHNKDNALIVRTPKNYTMRYIKALLNTETIISENEVTYSNDFKFTVSPNPVREDAILHFKILSQSKVSAQVLDLKGNLICETLPLKQLEPGLYNFKLDIPQSFSGVCLVKVIVNNTPNVKLLEVIR